MKNFFLKNMGCKSNQLEGALISQNLHKFGYCEVKKLNEADFYILNSCTVTHKSDNEVLYNLRNVKNKYPNIKTVLTGCTAQIGKEDLLNYNFIDYVIGNDEKLELAKFLDKNCTVKNIEEISEFHYVTLNESSKTRVSLKIQDGCNNRCSYCIIPFARGKNRSASVEYLLNQIKIFENANFNEIVLTGIHIGQWGLDFAEKKNLLYLLKNIEEKTNIKRFRLGSLNPLEIDDEMINFLKNSEKFCPHFHLSLQSMCDKTLKAMNRHYSAQQSLELIDKIYRNFDKPFIGSDVIAGFVGETEEDFDETFNNLKKSKITKIHTFPYSVRKGTIAEKMQGHLPDKIKQQRADLIKEISAQKHEQFLNKCIGTTQEILIEKRPDKNTGLLKGVTRNYINVLVDSKNNNLKNTLCNVKLFKNEQQIYGKLSQ